MINILRFVLNLEFDIAREWIIENYSFTLKVLYRYHGDLIIAHSTVIKMINDLSDIDRPTASTIVSFAAVELEPWASADKLTFSMAISKYSFFNNEILDRFFIIEQPFSPA